MSIRSGMNALINRVRTMIGDTSGTDEVFTDQEIQNTLDLHSFEERYLALIGLSDSNGQTLIWKSKYQNWDGDVVLVDAQYGALTPVTADYLNGRWVFAESQTMVYASGWHYDLYGACADLLEAWAAKAATEYDFTDLGQTFRRGQKSEALRAMAAIYRRRQLAKTIPQVRSDL